MVVARVPMSPFKAPTAPTLYTAAKTPIVASKGENIVQS